LDSNEISQNSIDQASLEAEDLAYKVKSGQIDKSEWQKAMIALIIAELIRQYLFGKAVGLQGGATVGSEANVVVGGGGTLKAGLTSQQISDLAAGGGAYLEELAALLTPEELKTLTDIAKEQAGYLSVFADALDALTISEIIRRAEMYLEATRQGFEQGKSAAYGIVLPAYPGDGSTPCLSNCRCYWQIESGDAILAYWRLGSADHCPTCSQRSQEWNPYIVK
jgi:hypothetical protein